MGVGSERLEGEGRPNYTLPCAEVIFRFRWLCFAVPQLKDTNIRVGDLKRMIAAKFDVPLHLLTLCVCGVQLGGTAMLTV